MDEQGKLSRRALFYGVAGGTLGVGLGASLCAFLRKPSLEEVLDLTTEPVDPKTAGRFVWNPAYEALWTEDFLVKQYRETVGHPTVVEKFRRLHERLKREGGLTERDFSGVVAMSMKDYGRVHTEEYLTRVADLGEDTTFNSSLLEETPIFKGTVQLQGAFVNGTYTAAQIALAQGIAMNLGGGLHHAMPSSEEGFCIFSDISIAIKRLHAEQKIEKAMIIDCDVHHGNGNAVALRGTTTYIADFYQENTYPSRKEKVQLPIALDTTKVKVDDDVYLHLLQRTIDAVAEQKPDVVFYLAGADPFEEDMLGDFQLSKQGLEARDRFIIENVRKMGIPVVVTLAGGYARNPDDLVDIHYNTAKVVKEQI
ncbi:histone deacetylase [Candidatus Woesearchaeota archaeon]|nr:histone deacetylase [Candidatus Woesearchaeota archaeon]